MFREISLIWKIQEEVAPGDVETYVMPCTQNQMLRLPHARTLAERIKASRDELRLVGQGD